jgi:putative transposase
VISSSSRQSRDANAHLTVELCPLSSNCIGDQVHHDAYICWMRELSAQYPCYGYRRVRILLGRDGHLMSAGRAYRLWRSAGLRVPRKRPRKRVAAARPRPRALCGPNQVWSYDFVFDRCANGRQLKCLTVTYEFTQD